MTKDEIIEQGRSEMKTDASNTTAKDFFKTVLKMMKDGETDSLEIAMGIGEFEFVFDITMVEVRPQISGGDE